jgi:branched-chain amino acid transport system substrate-binding protein
MSLQLFLCHGADQAAEAGRVLDMSGLFADITGPGSETAAKMAAEDFGGEVLGRKVQIVAADHLNKSDLAANIHP